MFTSWSVRKKILFSVATILIIALALTGMLSARLFKSALTERLESYELVRTVEAIRNELDRDVSVPMAQSKVMAANSFLLDWMAAGEPASGIPAWQHYAEQVRQVTGAATVSFVSETTGNYYDAAHGLSRQIEPEGKDGWFKAFMNSGQTAQFNLGIESGSPRVLMFTNVLAKDAKGQRASVSLGLDVTTMAERVRKLAIGKTGQVFVVDAGGHIQIHRNPELVKVSNKIELKTLPGLAEQADTLLRKDQFNLIRYQGEHGTQLMASSYLPSANWFVIVEISEAEVFEPINQHIRLLFIVDALVLAAALGLIFWLTTTLTEPLLRLRDAMRSLASGHGDLTQRLPEGSSDEIGMIAASFNRFMEQLHSMFLRVREQTNHLGSNVNQIAAMTEQLTQGAHQTAELSSSNAATIEQITVSIAQTADHTHDATRSVETASTLTSENAEAISQVSTEIIRVAQSMDELCAVMKGLENRSVEIGSVANVIKEIADQTNLLALNAAIEAARAGEQGRGFAVVADEVRKLAERTGNATVEIEQMVSSMRSEASDAMGRVGATQTSVQLGVGRVNTVLQQIDGIRDAMSGTLQRITEIRDAATEQSHATEALAQSAERMSQAAQTSDKELQQASVIISDLERMAGELRGVVESFRL